MKSTNIIVFGFCLANAGWCLGSDSIERVEYFVGEDPGHGNATELTIPEGESSIETELVFPAGSLPDAPFSQITIRAVDNEGNWSPPRRVIATTPVRPDDSEITLANAQFFFPEDSEAPDGSLLPIPSGERVAETEIQLPFEQLPKEGVVSGWAQAETSEGFRGPPIPFRVTAPPPERFASQDIVSVGTWHYSLLDGSDVVAVGTADGDDDLLWDFDVRDLVIEKNYSLILKPIADNGLPLHTAATEIGVIRDYEWWQRLHFTDTERADNEISGPNADPDDSGVTNFERFVGGSAPGEAFSGLRSGFEFVSDGETLRPLITLNRNRLAASTTLVLEVSENLQSWEEVHQYNIDSQPIDDSMERLEISPKNDNEQSLSDNRYYRIYIPEQ